MLKTVDRLPENMHENFPALAKAPYTGKVPKNANKWINKLK